MSDAAIRVQGLSKRYRYGEPARYRAFRDTLADALTARFRGFAGRLAARPSRSPATSDSHFWALRDVSFEVSPGEVLGIIGPNGAGKSTLLKILSRITLPTSGGAQLRGRLASLLEVGTGFHPELTGRENIFLNGAILGMRRTEITRKFDEIVSFAEVTRFIDTPVKHYSSGMYLRLAFAVAAHLEPEILLVDEVLAVGDAAFQKKCLGKMGEVASAGRTILFVSHNMAAVQQLTRASLLLDHGHVVAQGASEEVIRQYLNPGIDRFHSVYDVEHAPRRHPELRRQVEFLRLELEDHPSRLVPADADIRFRLTVRGNEDIDHFRFSVTVLRVDGTPVGNAFGPQEHTIHKGEVATFRMELNDLRLARGTYYCALATGQGSYLQERTEFDIVVDVLHFEMLGPLGEAGVMSEWFPAWGAIRFPTPHVMRIP
jgi:lipopolysaccharide transport system ATP-binding protein